MKKSILVLFVLSLACLMMATLAFGQAMPKPGEVIDKSNYKQYAHLIPKEFLQGFEDGFGYWTPFVMKVVESRKFTQPKSFLDLSEKNRGKYSIDKDGFIAGGYDYVGLPFPDVSKDDKEFATKFMYNYYYRYIYDDHNGQGLGFNKRRTESLTDWRMFTYQIYFSNRLIDPPKPFYKNPSDLFDCNLADFIFPISQKGMQMLSMSYLDQKKPDEVYIYLPTMRRVIRGDASQRSTPISGSTQSWDDINGGFWGKGQEFNYKLLGEQKVLGAIDNNMDIALAIKLKAENKGNIIPFPTDGYSVRDVWVIEITSKDPKYPQSKKVLYIDKENFNIYYCFALDRAGKTWKLWLTTWKSIRLPNGDPHQFQADMLGFDKQMGYGTAFTMDLKFWGSDMKYVDFLPANLLKRAH